MGAFGSFITGATTVLPEVPKPARKPSFTEKLIWTGIALIIYLIMSQIPLYGVDVDPASQIAFLNVIFASSFGTLMTLGIAPIVTAGLILQLLKGAEIIRLDFKKPEDRALFTSATKLLTLIVVVVEASAYIFGGALNPPGAALSLGTAAIVLLQLFAAGVLVMLLDELVQKGWGLGSGISLFIAAGVAQKVMWDIFSPLPVGDQYLGVLPFFFSSLLAGNPSAALIRAGGYPSLFTLGLTVLVILIVIYVEGMRIEIPITSSRYRGFSGVYPVKLLYVSNVPIILAAALLANLTFFSQLLWSRMNPNNSPDSFVSYIAQYNSSDPRQTLGGFIHYVTSPGSLDQALLDPIRAVTYVLFMVLLAVLFAKIWVEIGGLSPKAAAKSLIDAKVQVPGFRRAEASVESLLAKYIPTITIIGGMFIGLLASSSDLLGVFGTGIGILLMTGIIIQYHRILLREKLETMMPRLGALLGKG